MGLRFLSHGYPMDSNQPAATSEMWVLHCLQSKCWDLYLCHSQSLYETASLESVFVADGWICVKLVAIREPIKSRRWVTNVLECKSCSAKIRGTKLSMLPGRKLIESFFLGTYQFCFFGFAYELLNRIILRQL